MEPIQTATETLIFVKGFVVGSTSISFFWFLVFLYLASRVRSSFADMNNKWKELTDRQSKDWQELLDDQNKRWKKAIDDQIVNSVAHKSDDVVN